MRTASTTAESFIGHWPGSSAFDDWFERLGDSRTVVRPDVTVLLHGQCLASDDEVARGLATYSRTGRPLDLATWPGAYSALALRANVDLTVVTDPAGQFPVYFAHRPGGLLLASDPLRLADAIRAETDRIALSLYLFGLDDPVIAQGGTALAGVRRVEADRPLRIDCAGHVQWLDADIRTEENQSLDECAEILRPLLLRAVDQRVRQRRDTVISADFSGGIDSTSLAFLAATERQLPITLVTYHNPADPVPSDSERAVAFAKRRTCFAHRIALASPLTVPFQQLNRAPLLDLPNTGITVWARSELRLATAAQSGSTLHLTGDGGDLVATAPPAYLADLARHGSYAKLWRHCADWAHLRNRPLVSLLLKARNTGSVTPHHALFQLATNLADKHEHSSARWEDSIGYWEAPGETASWLTHRARFALAEYLHALAQRACFPAYWDIADYATRRELANCGALQRQLRTIARPLGLEVHSPFLDGDIVRTCLNLSARRRAGVHSAKPLLRKTLTGLVPDAVLTRNSKGDYTRDQYTGLRRAVGMLRSLLDKSLLAELDIIDPKPMLAALDRAALGFDIPWPAFNRVVAAELWLRQRTDRPPRAEPGADH